MAYTTIDKGSKYFNTVLYTGNGSARTITGVGFQPDWVWVKDRTSTNYHYLYDVLRGNNLNLFTNDATAEVNVTTGQNGGGIGIADSDGFTIVTGNINTNNVNTNTNLYASWNWKANGAGVSNTAGSITSTVSANTTSGFSIVSYTGNGTSGATIGHGLGAVPKMIIVKNRNGTNQWLVYHASLGATKYLILETTGGAGTASTLWNDTTPTTSLFTVGNSSSVNGSTLTYIAYCFAEVKGFSKAFSYTGNGSSDGTFIYTGMRPAWVLVKRTDTTGNWYIWDIKRNTFNVMDTTLYPNSNTADIIASDLTIDSLSNGFKIRGTSIGINASGGTYIGFAIAEQPFVSSKGIVANAR